MGAEHLHGQQANRAESDHYGAIAELWLCEPHTMQCDGADGCKSGFVEADERVV
jgi:hypothetical protein